MYNVDNIKHYDTISLLRLLFCLTHAQCVHFNISMINKLLFMVIKKKMLKMIIHVLIKIL